MEHDWQAAQPVVSACGRQNVCVSGFMSKLPVDAENKAQMTFNQSSLTPSISEICVYPFQVNQTKSNS